MTSKFGVDPEYSNGRDAELHSCYLTLGHGLLIHRSISSNQLYWPGPDASHMYSPQLLFPCLVGEGVRAGVRLDVPFCPVHVVVGSVDQPDCILTVLAQRPRHRIVAVACVWDNFLFGAQSHILLRRLGP